MLETNTDNQSQPKIRFATSPYFIAMVIVTPIVVSYHLAVEGEDARIHIITLLFLWWALALVGGVANIRNWKHLGICGRFGTIILAVIAVGFTPVVFFTLQALVTANY